VKLTEREFDIGSLIISEEQQAGIPRSVGIHVSDIVRVLSKAYADDEIASLQRPPRKNSFTEADLNRFAQVGRIWERVLAETVFTRPRYERIGEIEKDGIIGSPDAIDTVDYALAEYKVTYRSAKRPIETDFREWWWQQKSYCHMLGMVRTHLYVFYVCGNYSPPVPCAKEFMALFTPAELKENWAMMLRGRDELLLGVGLEARLKASLEQKGITGAKGIYKKGMLESPKGEE
jgi:hypothetical protein